jgi:hypothetical protein
MPHLQAASPDQRNALLCLVLCHLEEANAIISGRMYGWCIAGADRERVEQAKQQLLDALHDAQWLPADPEEGETDQAFRAFISSLLAAG